jgi:hypothetical protein
VSRDVDGFSSGFDNRATGGSLVDGEISGFFNTGVTAAFPSFGVPLGQLSGSLSGLDNVGSAIAGFFNLARL